MSALNVTTSWWIPLGLALVAAITLVVYLWRRAKANSGAHARSVPQKPATAGNGWAYRSGQRTDVGRKRPHNEDRLMAVEGARLHQSESRPMAVYAVADGMGGHSAGEVASQAIVEVISRRTREALEPGAQMMEPVAWMQAAVAEAALTVFSLRQNARSDMGSTLVMAMLEGGRAHVAHIGDSRAYLVRGGQMRRLTTDHSLVERLLATRQITPEEARTHPHRSVIYRTVGDKPAAEADVSTLELEHGDRLLLCSDGLSGMLTDEQLAALASASPDPQAACDRLVEAANASGGDDNISVILIEVHFGG